MFTNTHIIWLIISIVVITCLLLIVKKFNVSNKTVLTTMCIVSLISEVIKIALNMNDTLSTGKVLDAGSLPFHLCSIQIFFIYALRFLIKNENTKRILYNFIVPTSLVGATCSLFIPTCGTDFLDLQVYQYFIYHEFLIAFGLYIIIYKLSNLNFKSMIINICLLIALVFFNLWVNSLLQVYDTNFMYLTRPPMDNLPLLNLDNGWYVYFITLFIIALSFMILFHLPFIIYKYKKGISNFE